MKRATLIVLLSVALAFTACGGGGGGGKGTGPGSGSPTPAVITITNDAQLPDTLQGDPYSAILTAINGQAPLKWAIAQSPGYQLPTGIMIDPATGVLSSPNVQFGGNFVATVTDANSKSASKTFYIASFGKLVAGNPINASAYEFGFTLNSLNVQGGRPPLSYIVSSGSLPPGVRVTSFGQLSGTPTAVGTYSAVVTARDSWSTPQTVDQAVTITVAPSALLLRDNSRTLAANQPATITLFPVGGVPPYTFQKTSGAIPAGMNFDASTGKISGTPTSGGSSAIFQVKDSVGVLATDFVNFIIGTGLGRNDTPQTATAQIYNSLIGTLSPYIDPPDKAPLAADTDYYKMISMAGSTVEIYVSAGGAGLVDPVVEVVDGNGVRFATCNTPDFSSTNYSSPCVNDDGVDSSHNADVNFKVPGPAGAVVASYIHVLDWSGNARPDMQYSINLSGNIQPSYVSFGATRGVAYTHVFSDFQGVSPYTWSLDDGALPDGLSFSSSGLLSGTPTKDGQFSFRLKVSDSSNPVQSFYYFVTMTIGEPLKITSSASWPMACANQSYTYTLQSSGGVPNINWYGGIGFGYLDPKGVFTGFPTVTGTFTGKVTVSDFAGSTASQDVTVTVQNCP